MNPIEIKKAIEEHYQKIRELQNIKKINLLKEKIEKRKIRNFELQVFHYESDPNLCHQISLHFSELDQLKNFLERLSNENN